MSVLGRGLFSRVVESGDLALKVIYVDEERPPHNWKAEIEALKMLKGADNIVPMLNYELHLNRMESEVRIEMPKYKFTLENVVYDNAKANYPPGTGWRNVMPQARIVEIVVGVCNALEAIHSQGIIHRDIKPENIMFTDLNSEPVLIDFGIAWVPGVSTATEPEDYKITDASTGEYKPPELLFGVANYTNKIDMWCLGCILMRLLGTDCVPLFSPYRSDIALIAAQLKSLGVPRLEETPSLQESAAESMIKNMGAAGPLNPPKLRQLAGGETESRLKSVAFELMNYEMTRRPSASQIRSRLKPPATGP